MVHQRGAEETFSDPTAQIQEPLERQSATYYDLQNILYCTDIAILFLDSNLRIRFFTPATKALFNIIASDIGRPLEDLRSLTADDELSEHLRAVLRGDQAIEREVEVESGQWYIRRVLPYHAPDDAIDGLVITFTDITDRKRATSALQAANRTAEQASAAKSRFLAAAGHDLRQPLQSLTLLQALLVQAVEGDEAPQLVERLGQTLGAMSEMLKALLDINQIEAGVAQVELTVFSLAELFDRLRDEFTNVAQAKQLSLHIVPSSLLVRSDRLLLEQMTRNLLANALKFTQRGKILVGCRLSEQHLRIEIWDTGIGIAESELQTIFDEFHQVDNAARERNRGLGLGLSIVKQLGLLLDHEVRVSSSPGSGSVFSVDVPRAGANPPNTEAAYGAVLEPKATAGHQHGKIILVEDDPVVCELLELLLKADGHSVKTAPNGAAALKLVSSSAIQPEIILTDFNLPGGMNGLEVLSKIRASLHHPIPGIILSGDIFTEALSKIARHDCVRLSKPVQPKALSQTIQRLLIADRSSGGNREPKAHSSEDSVVYVIDDDEGVRTSIRSVLEEDGRVVESFKDAETFLAEYAPGREACLLIDAYLPGIGGLELLDQLRRAGDKLPAILMTGSSDVAMAIHALKAEASDFLEKPVSRSALLASIDRALGQSHALRAIHDRHEAAAHHLVGLSVRQHQIMDLVLAGHPSKNIAADLGISQRTVENHRAAIMHRTGAKSLPELARLVFIAAQESPEEDLGSTE
jgi:two-component system CheB/CheR fusion protein